MTTLTKHSATTARAASDNLPVGQLAGVGSHAAPALFSDFAEAATNAVIGLAVSWAATFFVLGYSPAQSIAITLMFFGLSFSRAWIIRRVFRGLS
ncbi:MAG: DUF7220 family protein [Pikeienuella sp.]